ncbi:hypothetical protein D9615_000229 [Tricholomella constricta]|uniref:Uncharacterized protein n=1 Tax=Tricholomella constricta TaxID=117010 RepID=A0A8H5HS43_9AGAR|nr:hypothetical protein D9615_000229 [Tricholomella constricta]
MTALPSFVELMASLGLDQNTKTPDQTPKSSHSSPSASPRLAGAVVPLHSRSKSIQSLRESSRPRVARYSPYSPVLATSRRGSLSSVSSCSLERDPSPLRAFSSPPRSASSPRFSRRPMNKLSVNVYGSASDLAANTPISSYVRRKTPGASPTSPTFSQGSRDSPPASPMPVTVPTLPTLWPNSANSDSFPITPNDPEPVSFENDYSFGDATKTHSRRHRRHVGIRISTPPRSAEIIAHHPRRRSLAHVA